MVVYLLSAIAVTAAAHTYVYLRLPRRRWLTLTLLALSALLPLGMLQLSYMQQTPRWLASPLMWVAFTWVGCLYFLLLTLLVAQLFRVRRSFALLIPSTLLSLFALYEGNLPPVVTETKITLPHFSSTIRLAHISDLHVGPTLGRMFVQFVVDAINAANVDYVCITGDIVDGSVRELADTIAPLKQLNAPVYVALGNHEYFSDANAWADHFTAIGLHVLRNQNERAGGITFVGIDELSAPEFEPSGKPDFAAAFAGATPPTIVLVHQPRALSEAAKHNATLVLAGHTHAGQLYPLHLLALLDQPFVEGVHSLDNTVIHVSPGTGYWGPPMRLFTRAAINILTLSP